MSGNRIDVHAHFVPEAYREALVAAGHGSPDGNRALPDWSENAAIDAMDRLGIATSYLSISSPGVYFGDAAAAAALARACNEYAVGLRERHRNRFGFFASVPVPDVDAAERELRTALDTMDADGLVLETNTDGLYLGDERLEPLYALLSERGSTLFVHPTTPYEGAHLALGYPRPLFEFFFETTRSIIQMILEGVLDRHPGMRVIVPHAGAALPILANRVEVLLPILGADPSAPPPSVRAALQRLHFDIAGSPVPELLTALLGVADPSRIYYGSDFPFTTLEAATKQAREFEQTDVVDDALREDVFHRNATRELARHPRVG